MAPEMTHDHEIAAATGSATRKFTEANGAKVILAGDIGQLQAVQNGGGMSLLADRLGYIQLVFHGIARFVSDA